jgi:hypothetical protein
MALSIELNDLEPFRGQWRMTPSFSASEANSPRALTTFEWLPGRRFLIQRWEVEHPDAPDGIAIIGSGPVEGTYFQHYFDSRGVQRVYDMRFKDHVWTLERIAEEPDFSQRFIGRFNEGNNEIIGDWEMSHDEGTT